MFAYSVKIPIRSSGQHTALAEFSTKYLTVGESPKFLGQLVTDLDCQTGEGLRRAECTMTFKSETRVQTSALRQMLKDLVLLDMEVRWCGPGSSGVLRSRAGLGVTYELIVDGISGDLPAYANEEACLI